MKSDAKNAVQILIERSLAGEELSQPENGILALAILFAELRLEKKKVFNNIDC